MLALRCRPLLQLVRGDSVCKLPVGSAQVDRRGHKLRRVYRGDLLVVAESKNL